MNSFDKIYRTLFTLGLFFFSFNQVEVMPFLGEYIKEFGAIFFFIGFSVLCFETLYKGKIQIPFQNTILKLIIIFYALAFICTILNIDTVLTNYFKRTNGISRFIRQYISLSIPILIFIPFFWRVFINMNLKESFYYVRKILLASLIFCSFYAFWETLYAYFYIYPAKLVLSTFDILPFMNVIFHNNRIASFTYEPPALAIYLITICGWMFSYFYTENNLIKKVTPTILILLLTFFSGSRTALLVITSVFLIFVVYLFITGKYRKQIILSSVFLIFLGTLVFFTNTGKLIHIVEDKIESLNFQSNLKQSVSNKTRFGMLHAMQETFKENPIIGVGFGQQAYHSRFHYPRWAKTNNWEFKEYYQNKKDPTFPPGYNLYVRLLAEMGIIGFFSWVSIIFYSFYKCYILIRRAVNEIEKVLTISIMFSLIGLYINWFQIDTFRMYGFWLFIILLIKIDEYYKNYKKKYEQDDSINTTL